MYLTDDTTQTKSIGSIKIEDSHCGVTIIPDLHGLSPGIHGFHIHDKPDCGDKGMAAAGHLDPGKTSKHHGPYKADGHLGDLPVLIVNNDGIANLPTFAPHLTVNQITNHSLMIHAGSDNYSDTPEKLGGGGARVACGVIKS